MRLPALALLVVLVTVHAGAAAEILTFRGSFRPIKAEDNAADKAFTVKLIAAGDTAVWTLTESGRGAWPWTERFGELPQAPALLYNRGDGYSIVPLPALRHAEPLATDSQWKQDGLSYRVTGEKQVGKYDAWVVVASNDYGPKRSLVIAKDGGEILQLDERVFVGQGIECQLEWELNERAPLDDKAADEILRAFAKLDALRSKLALQPQQREIKWSAEQRQLLRDELPAIIASSKQAPLVAVLQAAEKDVDTQDSRSDALAALEQKAVGQSLDKLSLSGIGGEKLTAEALKGQVTVLHFWDYRDTPLEEPYGQVGYLDFLARQQKGVKVYGVMVDERLEDTQTRAQAMASARKVKAFMNLSYPVLLDERGLVRQIGDPRTTGAKLPLWVVIGKDGKIAHYHVGFYDVKRDEGLAELDAAIRALSAKP